MNQPRVTKPSLQLVETIADGNYRDERLTLEWNWIGDRWQHRIAICAGGELLTLMTSVENQGAHGWPLSPPLQQIHVQSVHGEPVAFGLGSAGGTHWSITARLMTSAGVQPRHGLEFDIAATGTRDHHCWPPDFKSAYVLGAQCEAVEVNTDSEGFDTCSLRIENRTLRWAIQALGGRLQYSVTGRQIRIFPIQVAESEPRSARWSYRVGVI
ncbi:MAG TPA: hypothetical protein PKD54_03315 [Pirellulaceae bacterium]|nr:hypothetical protein [Pirellulaceae bacterium]